MGSAMRRCCLVVSVMVVAALMASACGAQQRRQPASSGSEVTAKPASQVEWSRLPVGPLGPRHGAHGFWVDDEFLVMGGRDTPACPPGADCVLPSEPALRDAASYSPATGRWTRLADAPVPLAEASTAVAGDVVYWWIPDPDGRRPTVLAYCAAADRWQRLPTPDIAGRDRWLHLVATEALVVAYRDTHERGGDRPDLAYDPALDAWRELPRDPLAPSFDRSMVWTGDEVVLLALDLVDNPGAAKPSLYRTAAYTLGSRSWRQLPDAEAVVGGWPTWFAVDGLVVNAAASGADGGETNGWGRWYPYGGIFDPAAASWSALPRPPEQLRPWLDVSAAGGRAVLNNSGWVFDVPTRTWTHVPRPSDGTNDAQAVALGDGRLYVWGGVTWDDDQGALSAAGWTANITPSS